LAEGVPIATRYQVVDANVAWRVADDEAVLLHAETSAYFGLNEVGTILWCRLAEQELSLDQLTDWARKRFADTPPRLREDIAAFLEQLAAPGLVAAIEGGDPTAPTTSELVPPAATPKWEAPVLQQFGELEKLILSGE
jgi:hypothetical protein